MKDDDSTAEVLRALPLRILLVEDDEFDVAVFGRAFRQADIPCEIVRCRSSEEALEGLRDVELAIDVLVTDHQLPGMSGFDLCLRLLEDGPPFALVLLTGGGSEQMAIQALKAGIQEYIVKDPAQKYLNLLPLVLPKVARRHRQRQARRQATAGLASADGLSDVAAVVRGRGGSVWIDEEGATPVLHLTVPLAADEVDLWAAEGEVSDRGQGPPPAAAGDPAAVARGSARHATGRRGQRRRRVLIAHPNPVVAYVASQAAEREECRFVVVESGRKAVEALERESFDLVLMGVKMPELDGFEATRRIRASRTPAAKPVTIVGLGVDAEAGEVERCLEAGMDAAVAAPLEPVGLHAALSG